MNTQQDAMAAKYEEIANTHFEDTQGRLAALAGTTKAVTKHDFKGNLAIIVSGIGYVHVVLTAEFPNGEKLRFEGDGGGIIVGAGGVSYGAGTSARSPSELVAAGPMAFALQATVAGAALECGGVVFVGGGPNIAAGHAWGSGRWTKV